MDVTLESLIAEINSIISSRDLNLSDKDKTFDDLGMDSLDQAQVLISLQDVYDFDVPEGKEDEFNSISKIYQLISYSG